MLEWLEMLGAWSLPHVWLPLAVWTLAAGPLYLLLNRWRSAHPLVQQHARQALLLALPLGLIATAALALLPEPQAGSALLPTLIVFPALPTPTVVSAGAAPAISFGLMHAVGLAALAAGLLALGRGTQLAAHAIALRRFRRTLPATTDLTLQRRTHRLAAAFGIRRRVRVVYAARPTVPMTFGLRRPVIVLPEALAADDEPLRMTLTHELIHIRRGDYLAQGLEQVIAAFFVVHPLVHVLRHSVAAWRERACDAAVLEDTRFRPPRYAALLRDLALAAPARQTATVALTERPDHLKSRIEAMKDYTDPVRRFLSPKRAGLLLGALLLGVAAGIVACTEMVDSSEPPSSTSTPVPRLSPDGETYMVVEKMPEIVGGLQAVYDHVEYPAFAREAGIEGTVYVQFTVDEEGNVVDPRIMKSPHKLLSEEALRAVEQLEFEPGKQRGQEVKVRLSLPIRFELPEKSDSLAAVDLGALGETQWHVYSGQQYTRITKGQQQLIIREQRLRESIGMVGVNVKSEPDVLYFYLRPGTPQDVQEKIQNLVENQFGDEAEIVVEVRNHANNSPLGLLEGQIDVGQLGIEGREMTFRDLEFSGNTVTGRIVDVTTSQPRPGANVVVQGRNIGAATDADGWFTIHADAPIEGITASFVGYETVQVQRQ